MTGRITTLTFAPLLAALVFGVPAAAQDTGGDKVRMNIVYGDDEVEECPEGMICVTGILPEEERYRIPEALRSSDDPANTAWAKRVEAFKFVGDFGTLSCSPSGAGGYTGCTQEMIDAAYEARANAPGVRFAKLIEAARAERLSEIDAEAAAEQERVESIERAYMERLERERDAEDAATAEPLPQPESSETPEG
ncbi:hypothetical protein LY632_02890 [Erythrobacter sp. SDW2]|uniref:hypothetical protein n=1 Tax=Erythrobacter sp. SDW2 TaxID=2907154 RepID=UPI001F323260|nr:hypothetical protein [Erythrobacter sp. SDW2]UIP07361.1 hypothetical protein LY632_02890 [Erythrobacter sp. SDW2]